MFDNKENKGRSLKVAASLTAIAVVALSAIGTSSAQAAGAAKIAAVIKGLDNPFFQTMQKGIEAQGKAGKVKYTIQAAADINDATGQADKLAAVGNQNYNCYIINPTTATNLIQALRPISKAGKTIVNIDQPLDAKAVKAAGLKVGTYIGTDNTDAGKKGGKFVASKIAAGSEVALIGGVSGNITSAQRIDGFKAGLGSAGKVVQEVAADWDRTKAMTAATDILTAHPNVKAFFAANDGMGLGIVQAVANKGLTGKVVVISVDGDKEALESIKAGKLTATIAQYPYAVGALGVQACQAAAAGKKLPKNVVSPTALVTSDNAEKAAKLFPQPFSPIANPFK